jgi:hypothetical protein
MWNLIHRCGVSRNLGDARKESPMRLLAWTILVIGTVFKARRFPA